MNVEKGDFEGALIELKSFIGTLRYLVEQARPDDSECDVFFTLANAADAIYAKFDVCFNSGNDAA